MGNLSLSKLFAFNAYDIVNSPVLQQFAPSGKQSEHRKLAHEL